MQQLNIRIETSHSEVEARVVFWRKQFDSCGGGTVLLDRVAIFRNGEDADWHKEMTRLVTEVLGDEFILCVEGGLSPSPPEELSQLVDYEIVKLLDNSELYLIPLDSFRCSYFLKRYSFPTLDALWSDKRLVKHLTRIKYLDLFGVQIENGRMSLPSFIVEYILSEASLLVLQPYEMLDTGDPILVYKKNGVFLPYDDVPVRLVGHGWIIKNGIVTFER